MRSTLLATAFFVSTLILGNTTGNADPLPGTTITTVPQAPIGHLQPRAQQFTPNSSAVQAEQQQQAIQDAQEQKLDEQLDKQLNICRGC